MLITKYVKNHNLEKKHCKHNLRILFVWSLNDNTNQMLPGRRTYKVLTWIHVNSFLRFGMKTPTISISFSTQKICDEAVLTNLESFKRIVGEGG